MSNYDVAIIGGGIAGISLAWRLAAYKKVLLLEQESHVGYHATGRSAAMFMETYGSEQMKALTRASRDFYLNAHQQGFCAFPLFSSPRSCIYLATKDQVSLLQRKYELEFKNNPNTQLLSAEQVLSMVPFLRPEVVGGGIVELGSQDIDVHSLLDSFMKGAKAKGAHINVNSKVIACKDNGQFWTLTTSAGQQFQAEFVVNASGAWVDEFAKLAGVDPIGFTPCRRAAFTFDAPDGLDLCQLPMVIGIEENYYFKPDAGQLLGSPSNADPDIPHDVVADELDIATGIYHIEEVTTLNIRRPRHTWAGLRTFSPDHEFVVGWDAKHPRFFWLAGQGGYGIQSCPGASLLAMSLLLKAPLPDELRNQGVNPVAVSPVRFQHQTF